MVNRRSLDDVARRATPNGISTDVRTLRLFEPQDGAEQADIQSKTCKLSPRI
jgi:hypothetical protein